MYCLNAPRHVLTSEPLVFIRPPCRTPLIVTRWRLRVSAISTLVRCFIGSVNEGTVVQPLSDNDTRRAPGPRVMRTSKLHIRFPASAGDFPSSVRSWSFLPAIPILALSFPPMDSVPFAWVCTKWPYGLGFPFSQLSAQQLRRRIETNPSPRLVCKDQLSSFALGLAILFSTCARRPWLQIGPSPDECPSQYE